MQGWITERDFSSAERWFPGIRRLYRRLSPKPLTFLELLWRYEEERRFTGDAPGSSPPANGRHK